MNMKKAAQFANEAGTGQLDRAQRTAYLNSKGINPGAQFQLDLVFPETIGDREDLRHIPNDYARSSIFTARNKRAARRNFLHEKLFHYNEFVTILYTGIELRAEDDEIIWLQILNYGQRVPLGDSFEFSIKDLVSDVGWHKNGRYYDKARECISRLKANEVLALNSKAYGKSGAISLIQNYEVINDAEGTPTEYRVWIDKNLILLFAGNTFTSHAWEMYRELSRLLAAWLTTSRATSTLTRFRLRSFSKCAARPMPALRAGGRRSKRHVSRSCKRRLLSMPAWLMTRSLPSARLRLSDGDKIRMPASWPCHQYPLW